MEQRHDERGSETGIRILVKTHIMGRYSELIRKAASILFLILLATSASGQGMDFAIYSRQRDYDSRNDAKPCIMSYSNLNGGKIYCNGKEISQEQYHAAVMAVNPNLWLQYDGGSKNMRNGIIMMSVGTPLFFGGLIMSCLSPNYQSLLIPGYLLSATGAGLTAGGVACYVVGVQRRYRSVRNYNKLAGSTATAMNISLGVCPSGGAGIWMTY